MDRLLPVGLRQFVLLVDRRVDESFGRHGWPCPPMIPLPTLSLKSAMSVS
jgi:hypothetical protein